MDKLILNLERALEDYWTDIANLGYATDSGSVYDYASDLESMGIGAVLIPTMQGQLKWFDLESMSF